jgi:hypothetical protein
MCYPGYNAKAVHKTCGTKKATLNWHKELLCMGAICAIPN